MLFFSCDEVEDVSLTYNSEIISIEYGTSFGECLGYCIRSIEITGTYVEFEASGWTITDTLPDINISGDISIEDWENLVELGCDIDGNQVIMNRQVFESDLAICIGHVLGNPYGGVEWIVITTSELSHKVTFEYLNEPEEVQSYIDNLRNLMEQYGDRIN